VGNFISCLRWFIGFFWQELLSESPNSCNQPRILARLLAPRQFDAAHDNQLKSWLHVLVPWFEKQTKTIARTCNCKGRIHKLTATILPLTAPRKRKSKTGNTKCASACLYGI